MTANPMGGATRRAQNMISTPFLFLRGSTAASSVLTGIIQTFIFARVLSPEHFSLFILVGTAGLTLIVGDLGAAKVLFVRWRNHHLAGRGDPELARQTGAVVAFYILLAFAGSLLCLPVMARITAFFDRSAVEFALFFLFTALNLAWFALRNIAMAVDEYVYFEILESARRVGNIAAMVSLLIGVPVLAYVIVCNLLWLVMFSLIVARLVARGTLTWRLSEAAGNLAAFYRSNRANFSWSAMFSMMDIFIFNIPFLVVPAVYGLGAPTIILDTSFKVLRAGGVAYTAASDLMTPRQTKAFIEKDAPALIRATLMAAGLCAVAAAIASGVLLTEGKSIFAILLGHAATMPPATIPILISLLFGNLVYMTTQMLLLHTGAFRDAARAGTFVATILVVGIALAYAAGATIVGFLAMLAGVYGLGAAVFLYFALRGPLYTASAKLQTP